MSHLNVTISYVIYLQVRRKYEPHYLLTGTQWLPVFVRTIAFCVRIPLKQADTLLCVINS